MNQNSFNAILSSMRLAGDSFARSRAMEQARVERESQKAFERKQNKLNRDFQMGLLARRLENEQKQGELNRQLRRDLLERSLEVEREKIKNQADWREGDYRNKEKLEQLKFDHAKRLMELERGGEGNFMQGAQANVPPASIQSQGQFAANVPVMFDPNAPWVQQADATVKRIADQQAQINQGDTRTGFLNWQSRQGLIDDAYKALGAYVPNRQLWNAYVAYRMLPDYMNKGFLQSQGWGDNAANPAQVTSPLSSATDGSALGNFFKAVGNQGNYFASQMDGINSITGKTTFDRILDDYRSGKITRAQAEQLAKENNIPL